MGMFILYKGKGFLSRQIEKHQIKQGHIPQRAKYTHVEILGGGQWSVFVGLPKSKVVDIRKKHKGRHICIVKYKNKEYEEKKRYKVAFWAASQCNLKYDWLGILKFKISWLWHFKKRYFCSENSLWALQKEFPSALGKEPHNALPADFLLPKWFEIIYEGDIPNRREIASRGKV